MPDRNRPRDQANAGARRSRRRGERAYRDRAARRPGGAAARRRPPAAHPPARRARRGRAPCRGGDHARRSPGAGGEGRRAAADPSALLARLPVFIYHRRYESVRTNVSFPSDDALDGFVLQLVQRSGKHISVADPLVDATLPEGSRLQASLSREVTTRGSTFTIRKFRKDPFTPTDLLAFETMSPEMMAYWWLAVEHGASAIICGGTASGKTTTLNALSLFIPPNKKIVSIEDTRELNIPHDNWIPGVTRTGGAQGATPDSKRTGEVDMFGLL